METSGSSDSQALRVLQAGAMFTGQLTSLTHRKQLQHDGLICMNALNPSELATIP